MLAQSCFENECWPPDITAVLPKVLPVLRKINFEVLFKNMLEKGPANNAGEEKRAATVTWVHTESGNLYNVLLHPVECCQPYDKVAGGICELFIHYAQGRKLRNTWKPVQHLGILQGNALEQYFCIQFLIKVITFAILESMTNYFPSREAIIQEGSLVSCSV